jgi:hypothetical protein
MHNILPTGATTIDAQRYLPVGTRIGMVRDRVRIRIRVKDISL